MTESVPPGGVVLDPDTLEAMWADAWRPDQVAAALAGVRAPWYIAAGWALDLFCGQQSRPHSDLEIAVPVASFSEIRNRFPQFVFDAVGAGRVWPDAGAEALAATRQTWLRDPAGNRFLFDVFREPHEGATWICRRDESLRLSYDAIIEHTADGIPYLAPELVLLFKAKATRPKDQADFDRVLPLLSLARRTALSGWLGRTQPGHPWLARLGSSARLR